MILRNLQGQPRLSVYVIAYLSISFIIAGCSSLTVSTPMIQRVYPEGLAGGEKILFTGFEKERGRCLKEEIIGYLKETHKFSVISPSTPLNDKYHRELMDGQDISLILSGETEKYTADIRIAEGLLKNYLIPYAIISANMTVLRASTQETVWSKKETVFVEGEAKGRISREKVKEMLLPVACKNLATKMLNDFLKAY